MVHGSPLNAPVITLGEKKSLFGEKAQANEYVSYALYYWPDPANPDGPYKPIDGKKNKRLRSMDDSGRMAAFISTVCSWDGSINSTGIRRPPPGPGNG